MNRMLIAAAVALVALGATEPVLADEPVDCSNAMSTYEINFCADKDLAKADAALNAIYQKALAKIAESDQEKPYDAKSWEAALRESQRAWVAFRDADCKGLVPMAWAGGSGTSMEVLGCMTAKTDARTKELKERLGLE
jgi:uncharacterized protein YecT (DUF1311 family)